MKLTKIYTVVAAAGMLMGMASCQEVTDPKLQTPDAAQFKMVTPALQNEYFELTPDGTINLGVNAQPNYGFSAVTQYRVQVALVDDFSKEENYREIQPNGSGTLVNMTISCLYLAEAITDILGIEDAENFPAAPMKLYFRGVAFIKGVQQSYVTTSNTVSLNNVKAFWAVAKPGEIYCIGNYAGDWISPQAANVEDLEPYTLREKEDAIRSKIYYGTITFANAANNCTFRFYTALNGWDNTDEQPMNSVGPTGGNDDDHPVKFADFGAGSQLKDQPLMATKDSFELSNYMGTLSMEVNLADEDNMTATITAVAEN